MVLNSSIISRIHGDVLSEERRQDLRLQEHLREGSWEKEPEVHQHVYRSIESGDERDHPEEGPCSESHSSGVQGGLLQGASRLCWGSGRYQMRGEARPRREAHHRQESGRAPEEVEVRVV